MNRISELYKEVFELNSLVSMISAEIKKCKEPNKHKILTQQRDIWINKIQKQKEVFRGRKQPTVTLQHWTHIFTKFRFWFDHLTF